MDSNYSIIPFRYQRYSISNILVSYVHFCVKLSYPIKKVSIRKAPPLLTQPIFRSCLPFIQECLQCYVRYIVDTGFTYEKHAIVPHLVHTSCCPDLPTAFLALKSLPPHRLQLKASSSVSLSSFLDRDSGLKERVLQFVPATSRAC